jgi:hypothetical protein
VEERKQYQRLIHKKSIKTKTNLFDKIDIRRVEPIWFNIKK